MKNDYLGWMNSTKRNKETKETKDKKENKKQKREERVAKKDIWGTELKDTRNHKKKHTNLKRKLVKKLTQVK